jgi:hypothetical protein
MNVENLNIFKELAPDSEAIAGGVWCEPRDKLGRAFGFKVCVRPVTHPAYLAALEAARVDNIEDIQIAENPEEFSRRSEKEKERLTSLKQSLTAEAIAKSILVDWDGIEDENGALPYTWQNGKDLMSHVRMSEVADGILRCCLDRLNFTETARRKGLELLKKN